MESNIRITVTDIECSGVDWFNLAQDITHAAVNLKFAKRVFDALLLRHGFSKFRYIEIRVNISIDRHKIGRVLFF